ncbi:MAG: RtcB family protein [Dehalococcoidia bacterium]
MPTSILTENEFGRGEVLSWASIVEDACIDQATMMSRHPAVKGHLALMPDAHFGFGPPVGSAIVFDKGVMPYAVGVDIGCGMIAHRTTLKRGDFNVPIERHVVNLLAQYVPAGVGKDHGQTAPLDYFVWRESRGLPPGITEESGLMYRGETLTSQLGPLSKKIALQFGTLGAGNHFVEVACDEDENVWFFLHSGSRGIGNILATAHTQKAKAQCKEQGKVLEHPDFAWFEKDSPEYAAYWADMQWAQDYAYAQREAMMRTLTGIVDDSLQGKAFDIDQRVNCHHNYAETQEDGTILTRKGAIDASFGKYGAIPGSMGTSSYIVQGLGNEDAYRTSAHGAGRVLGRKAAKKALDIDEFKNQMAGKTWQDRDAADLLDEAPNAYKPIEQVLLDSKELVCPTARLTQFINYKGTKGRAR